MPGRNQGSSTRGTTRDAVPHGLPTQSSDSTSLAELARRESDGVDVALWWDRASGELVVSVVDRNAGDAFDIPTGAAEALDVFNHPYAYADARHVLHRDLAIRQPVGSGAREAA